MNKKILLALSFCVLAMFSFVLAASQRTQGPLPKALWGSFGLLINDTIGNTPQQNPKILSDSQDNYLVLWEDARNGFFNIYAQKLNSGGTPLWNRNGIQLAAYSGNQNFPQAVLDKNNESIMVWQDYRSGNADIFAQKINAYGQLVWSAQGVEVCAAPAGQFSPQIVSDGMGGAIIVWHDYRNGGGEDIYAQRIDTDGNALWEKDGIAISQASGTQWYPQIASDNNNGAIIVWTDGREGSGNNNIYGQRIGPSGNAIWKKNGIPLCDNSGNQERPIILAVNNGYVLAWNDSRYNNTDIFAQKIDDSGNLLWSPDGVAVCTANYTQNEPKLAQDGTGGAILVWNDERAETNDIFGQRIDQYGKVSWQENGRAICKAFGDQNKPEIVKLSNDSWMVFWEDQRSGNIDIFAQKINSSATPLWKTDGISIASFPNAQDSFSVCSSPAGNALVVWQDSRYGSYDIFAQKVSGNSALLWPISGLIVCNAIGSVVQQNINLAGNNKGEIFLAFEDSRSGYFNIYLQKINQTGNLSWGNNGIAASKVAANQSNPQLEADDQGTTICWEDYRINKFPSIRARKFSGSGAALWPASLGLADILSSQTNPVMVSDNNNGIIAAWHDNRNTLSLQDIYIQRVSASGKLLWGKTGKAAISENGDQTDLDMVTDGTGGAYLTWTDYRNGDRNPDIYAQHISASGDPLWKDDGVLICGAPDIQRSPKIVRDEAGGIIISWTDKGGGSYDIFAQRLDNSGRPMWMTDGIPINQLSRTQQNPKFGSPSILVWEDYRLGNWDIYAGSIDVSGKLKWGEDGAPIVTAPFTQYAPRIAPWKQGSVIVVWEDYRSGQEYDIFIQKIDALGDAGWANNGIKIESQNGARAPKIIADPKHNAFYVFWEDFTNGGRATFGQKYSLE